MNLRWRLLYAAIVIVAMPLDSVWANHFRGGTISWEPIGGTTVHFYTKLGWRWNMGCGCIGKTGNKTVCNGNHDYWECQFGCPKQIKMSSVNYQCTGTNQADDWEQGEKDFIYTFPSEGPFTVGYNYDAWMALSPPGKGSGDWNVATTVDLRKRSDTGGINRSPKSLSKPLYNVMYDCEMEIQIPNIDPDGDTIRCRFAKGAECESVCDALPGAMLDQERCTLRFNTTKAQTYIQKGYYAVALMIEDFPKTPMTIGTTTKTPADPISSVPLQFMVTTYPKPIGGCTAIPRFVDPSPAENDVIMADEGDNVLVDLFADNGSNTTVKIDKIEASGPVALTQSPLVPEAHKINTFTSTLSWQTSQRHLGNHIVCGSVYNALGASGKQRCFTIRVVQKGCKTSPCQNGGKCTSNKGNNTLLSYTCTCLPGFSGLDCQTNIDDCTPNPCPCGQICIDGIHKYTCSNDTKSFSSKKHHAISSCPVQYKGCDCVFSPQDDQKDPPLLRRGRDLWAFCLAVPFGLLLSISTYYLGVGCREWWNSKTRTYPQPRPITAYRRKLS